MKMGRIKSKQYPIMEGSRALEHLLPDDSASRKGHGHPFPVTVGAFIGACFPPIQGWCRNDDSHFSASAPIAASNELQVGPGSRAASGIPLVLQA